MSHFTGKIITLKAVRGDAGKLRLDFTLELESGRVVAGRVWDQIAEEILAHPEDDPITLKGTIAKHSSRFRKRGMLEVVSASETALSAA